MTARKPQHRRRTSTFAGEKIRIDERTLRRIPKAERALLVGLWHVTNELNTLSKLILLASGSKIRGQFESSAKALIALVLIKVFAAEAVEGWKLFKRGQRFAEFKEKYLQHADSSELIQARDWLDRYFQKGNLLQKVRNKLGAHYDYRLVTRGSDDLSKLDSFIFLTDQQGNSLYWVAEELLLRSLKGLGTAGESVGEIYSRLLSDVGDVVANLSRLAQTVSIIALEESGNRKQFELSLTHRVRFRVAKSVDIPFFVDFGMSPEQSKKRKR